MENEEERLKKEIKELETQIEPKRKRLHEIWEAKSDAVKERIQRAIQGNGHFELHELIFAAKSRCKGCSSGLAYPKDIGPDGTWYCSAILLGKAARGSTHEAAIRFAFHEVKSEKQTSARGATTRPASILP